MKVLEKEKVTRYKVQFDQDEIAKAKEVGLLPPYALQTYLWLTEVELMATVEMLYGGMAKKDFDLMLKQLLTSRS